MVNTNTSEAKAAKEIAIQFIAKKTGRSINSQIIRTEVEIMLRLTEEMESKYELVMNNMCNRMNVKPENAHEVFDIVVREILETGINWGRIVSIHAFGGKLAEHFKNNDILVDQIGLWIGNSVAKKSSWIRDEGHGWDGFMETYREQRSWFQGIFATTVGLGTIAAVLYAKS